MGFFGAMGYVNIRGVNFSELRKIIFQDLDGERIKNLAINSQFLSFFIRFTQTNYLIFLIQRIKPFKNLKEGE